MPYATREDLEIVFGPINVSKWADLDGNENAAHITARIEWALSEATLDLNSRLRGGPWEFPFAADPVELVTPCAKLAGCLLYDSRGVQDYDGEGQPVNQLSSHRKWVDQIITQYLTGKRRFEVAAMLSTAPEVGPAE